MKLSKISTLLLLSLTAHVAIASSEQYLRSNDPNADDTEEQIPDIRLNNGKTIPLVGMGVGNLPHESIPDAIANGFSIGNNMIDTARASQNEHLISESLNNLNLSLQYGMTNKEKSIVQCSTSKGDFTMEFIQEWSPKGYARAVDLFRRGFYDDSHFFRTIPYFLTQFGLSYTDDAEAQDIAIQSIPDDPQLRPCIPFTEGTISYAGSGPNSRTSQLFIAYQGLENFGRERWETPIGFVKEGMDTIRRLNGEYEGEPEQPKIRQYGLAYIQEYFPNLDKFNTCSVETIAGSPDADAIFDNGVESVHIVTKVWYTHLGYERTKISITESLRDLSSIKGVKVHLLLHWPRCNDEIQWMNCEEEEERLPQYVKDAGPPPHLNADSWKESWRAMEDLYKANDMIESIGVSNFEIDDMKALLQESQIKPQLYQGNVWKIIFDPHLMDLLKSNAIVFQAYGIMSGIIMRSTDAPNAFSVLGQVGRELMDSDPKYEYARITEAMVVEAWLVQSGISIIPRSTKHQKENSPSIIGSMPMLSPKMKDQVSKAVSSLMKGQDLEILVTFHNNRSSGGSVNVHWYNHRTGDEIQVIDNIENGDSITIGSHPQHRFVVYDETKTERKEYVVNEFYGGHEKFSVGDEL